MPRKQTQKADIDIFDDNLTDAFAAATAEPATAPEPAPAREEKVIGIPARTEAPTSATTMPPASSSTPRQAAPVATRRTRPKPVATPTEATDQTEKNTVLKLSIPAKLRGEWKTFVAQLEGELGVALDDSNVGRAIIEKFLIDYSERILELAPNYRGSLRRPEKKDRVRMAEFDEALGDIFQEARKRRRTPMPAPSDQEA